MTKSTVTKLNAREVYYQDIAKYRQDICLEMYQKSFELNSKIITVLEIGPSTDNALYEFKSVNQSMSYLKYYFIEPEVSNLSELKNKFPSSYVFQKTLESVIDSSELPTHLDLIVANFSLHWVKNPEKIAKTLFSHLRDGGVIAFSNTDANRSFWRKINNNVNNNFSGCSLFDVEQSHSLSAIQWSDLFISAGFDVIELTHFVGTAGIFKSVDAALANLKKMTGTKYLKISNGFTAQEIEDFARDNLKSYLNSNGKLEIEASAFTCIMQKYGINNAKNY